MRDKGLESKGLVGNRTSPSLTVVHEGTGRKLMLRCRSTRKAWF